jgi:hypothetical protein
MQKLKKAISLMFSLIVLCSYFSSCTAQTAGDSDSGDTGISDTQEASETIAETEDDDDAIFKMPNEMHDVPKLDFNGSEFKILYPEWQLYRFYLNATEFNGSTVNDALYNRTLKVNDYLNVNITMETIGYIEAIEPQIKNAVMAGDNTYDMFITHCITGLIGIVSQNYALDWNKVPYVDFSKPYWNQSFTETLTVYGKTPLASSDLLIADPNVIFFNKDIANDNNLEDPYQLVHDGKWTLDKMIEMASGVSVDLDGNGKFMKNDQYGIYTSLGWVETSFLYGCDQYICAKDDNGFPTLALNSEKTVNIIEKLYKLFCESNIAYTTDVSDLYIDFENCHGLFYILGLAFAADYRETEVDYGILPFPKYDEVQENYISLNWGGLQCLPKTTSDLEMVGAVSEVLAYESREQVLPAYFDNLLGYKIARDKDSIEMLKIIFDNCVHDFGLNFSNHNDMMYIIANLMRNKSTDVASYIKSREKAFTKQIERIYLKFADID